MENLVASGVFYVLCYDEDGNLKWEEKNKNLVVNAGVVYMAGTALTSVTQLTTWYIGLYGAGATNSPAKTDTMASHAGWTEVTTYSQATRPTATLVNTGDVSGGNNTSIATNTASVAVFSINGSTTVGGAFLTSNNVKGGTSGTLFSASDFTGGDRAVVNGDTLNVTYTFTLTGN
jgi:hypothetical protein